jgi:hypothetical protein
VDEMEIHLVPTLLGGGERLFEGAGDDLHGLEPRAHGGDPEGDAPEVREAALPARIDEDGVSTKRFPPSTLLGGGGCVGGVTGL